MFCFQCQETAKNSGCTVRGVCGKREELAELQDLLIYVLKGISIYGEKLYQLGILDRKAGLFTAQGLFATITNANWSEEWFFDHIRSALRVRNELRAGFLAAYKEKNGKDFSEELHDAATWFSNDESAFRSKAKEVGVLSTEHEDVRSLREMLVIGSKGISAYADHAAMLGFEKDEIYAFLMEALASTTRDLSVDEMVAMS